MPVAEEIASKREMIIDKMLALSATPNSSTNAEENRQFVAGYVNLLEQAAKGNLSARDEYLEVIVPGVKQAGMTMAFVLGIQVAVSMAIASLLSDEALTWCTHFSREYTVHFVAIWERV